MAIISITLTIFGISEALFMLYIMRWVSSSKRSRESEFALLDKERQALLELQKSLREDAQAAREATKVGLAKLQSIGLETHAEWTDMTARFDEVVSEIERRSRDLVDDVMRSLNKKGHECLKTIEMADTAAHRLSESIEIARKVSRFFDAQVKIEDLLRELQQDKYQEASRLLKDGMDAKAIARKLGLSISEVSLVAHSINA